MKKMIVALLLMLSLLSVSGNAGEYKEFAGDEDYDPVVAVAEESVSYL